MEKPEYSINELRVQIAGLQNEMENLKKLLESQQKEKEKLSYDLTERKKELQCHNKLSKLFSKPGLSNEKIIQKILNIIPASWQFPELTEVRIKIGDEVFQTPGYASSKYELKQKVVQDGEVVGEIIVAYPTGNFHLKQEAFLTEEKDLLISIAERLGNFLLRQNNTQKLRESLERYKSLIEFSPDVTVIIDLSGKVRYYARNGSKMFGYADEDDLEGKSMFDFIVESDHTRSAKLVEDLLMHKEVGPQEFTGLKADGSTFPMESKGELIIDSEGNSVEIIFSIRDISDRKRMEQSLIDSENMLSTIMDNVPGIIYRCLNNEDWTMIFMSEGCKELTGRPSSVFIGDNALPYNEIIHPDDRARVAKAVAKGLKRGNSFEIEYRIINAEGEIKHVWEKGKGVIDGGKVSFLEGFIMDVRNIK